MITDEASPTDTAEPVNAETVGVSDIERVARAMWRAESLRASGRPRLIDWFDENPETRDKWEHLARAAIEAMRPVLEDEPVAWRYDCIKAVGDRLHLDPPFFAHSRANMDPRYWTETPLYRRQA